jgi:hypothetical protein
VQYINKKGVYIQERTKRGLKEFTTTIHIHSFFFNCQVKAWSHIVNDVWLSFGIHIYPLSVLT